MNNDFFWSYAKGVGVVQTIADSNVTSTSFDSGCILLNNGGVAGWAGIAFSYISNPPVIGDGFTFSYPLIDGIGTFARTIGGLTPDTDWYFRAYYETYEGIVYGTTYTIHTLPDTTYSTPDVTTASISQTSTSTASCGGNATNDGGDPITEKGVCWNTSGNPTYASSKTNDGTGEGAFSSTLTGLIPGNTYYVKAYAKNGQGVGYGAQVSVLIVAKPEVYAVSVSAISTTTATSGGDVTSANGAAVTARGICWNTTGTLDTLGTNYTTDGTGTGIFSSAMTGLSPNTLYYIQAYATNSEGTNFSSQGSFTTTSSGTLPTVTTETVNNILLGTASSGGNVTADGGSTVTARGVCWSTSTNPTIADPKTVNGSGTGSFTSQLTGLASGTTFYVRAYATNASGTAYGNQLSFTMVCPAIGSNLLGGIVAYLFVSGDVGYVSGECHGLLASPYDLSTGDSWSIYNIEVTGADATAIGTGYDNTSEIVDALSTNGHAALMCYQYEGVNGWFLPSRDELDKILHGLIGSVGGITDETYYWSSSEYGSDYAYAEKHRNSDDVYIQVTTAKTGSQRVRAIKYF